MRYVAEVESCIEVKPRYFSAIDHTVRLLMKLASGGYQTVETAVDEPH